MSITTVNHKPGSAPERLFRLEQALDAAQKLPQNDPKRESLIERVIWINKEIRKEFLDKFTGSQNEKYNRLSIRVKYITGAVSREAYFDKTMGIFTTLKKQIEGLEVLRVVQSKGRFESDVKTLIRDLEAFHDMDPSDAVSELLKEAHKLKVVLDGKCKTNDFAVKLAKLKSKCDRLETRDLHDHIKEYEGLKNEIESLPPEYLSPKDDEMLSRKDFELRFEAVYLVLRRTPGSDKVRISPPFLETVPTPLDGALPARKNFMPIMDPSIKRFLEEFKSVSKLIQDLESVIASRKVSETHVNEIKSSITQNIEKIQSIADRLAPLYQKEFSVVISQLQGIKENLSKPGLTLERLDEMKENVEQCKNRVATILGELKSLGKTAFQENDYLALAAQHKNAEELIQELNKAIAKKRKGMVVGSVFRSLGGSMQTAAAKTYNFFSNQYLSHYVRGPVRAFVDCALLKMGQTIYSDPENYLYPLALSAALLSARIATRQSPQNPVVPSAPAAAAPARPEGALLIRPEKRLVGENPLAPGELGKPQRDPFPFLKPENDGLKRPPAAVRQGEAAAISVFRTPRPIPSKSMIQNLDLDEEKRPDLSPEGRVRPGEVEFNDPSPGASPQKQPEIFLGEDDFDDEYVHHILGFKPS